MPNAANHYATPPTNSAIQRKNVDVIVGAPFEDAGAGAAYVYHGCDAGLVDHYAQKLSPALLHLPALRGFAHSFASRMDIDDNRYPGMTARRSPFRSRFYRSSTAIGRLCVCVCLSVCFSLSLSVLSVFLEQYRSNK